MQFFFRIITMMCLGFSSLCIANQVVWKGKVQSDGNPTPTVKLIIGQRYKLKVSNTMNLGKWRTNKQPLANDACYEFFANSSDQELEPTKVNSIKNSLNIALCNDKYNPDHIYESNPFLAAQSGIHFWIDDTYYEDNTGALDLEVIQVEKDKNPSLEVY